MSLEKIDVSNVRNIETTQLEFSSRLNFIIGPNGSGKTSLLEALYILGRARSFRSTQAGRVIRFGQESLTVNGRVIDDAGLPSTPIGVRLGRRKREIVLAGSKLLTSAELIRAFPVLLIHPHDHSLLDDAPKFRRQFLDWGAFHLDKEYLRNWRGYARALNQRNALLRVGNGHGIEIWNRELCRYGTIVAQAREAYVEQLRPFFHDIAGRFLGSYPLSLLATHGWKPGRGLDDALREDIAVDLRDGYTHSGPHKGDFSILIEERAARDYFSRGQMKLLVFSLLLAQAQLLEESSGVRGCVLIDDLASELDAGNRRKLLSLLHMLRTQFFITTTEPDLLKGSKGEDAAVFHVENGRVSQI